MDDLTQPQTEQRLDTEEPSGFLSESAAEVDAYEFFLFELDGELYAVSVADVDQVMKIPPITSVPNAPVAIAGIFHLRGRVVVALDLLKRMHLTRTTPLFPYYLFVAHRDKNYFAILVDRSRTVLRVPKTDVKDLDPVIAAHIPQRFASGMFMYKDKATLAVRHKAPNFMIEPPQAVEKPREDEFTLRPVIWLNVEELIDQDDLLGTIAVLAKQGQSGGGASQGTPGS